MFPAAPNTMVIVKNASGSPVTVTVTTPQTVGGRAVAEDSGSVPATTGERWFGPFTRQTHGQPSGADRGKVYIGTSAQTSVTLAVVQV
jgi:hypothetical protein